MGFAKILHYNENTDEILSAAGRISTMDGTATEIYQKSVDAGITANQKLISKVMSSGHTSTLEHASVNIAFEDVSVLFEQFLIEFRLMSFTVKSRRYVNFSKAGYFDALDIQDGEAHRIFSEAVENKFAVYDKLVAAGVPVEDARFVLPYCFCSNILCTVNCRELIRLMNELVYGRGSRFPEFVAIGERLFAPVATFAPYLECRKPLDYCRGDFNGIGVLTNGICAEYDFEKLPEVTVMNDVSAAADIILRAGLMESGMSPLSAIEISDTKKQEIFTMMLNTPRKRALEQANFTLLFKGMSLAAITHMTRHRMQSLVTPNFKIALSHILNGGEASYVRPESIYKNDATRAIYEEAFAEESKAIAALREYEVYDELYYLLLAGTKVPVMTTMNANELDTFFRLRCCNRAQWEIREYAMAALKELREECPVLFNLYGASCSLNGKCPEGRMCCGKPWVGGTPSNK